MRRTALLVLALTVLGGCATGAVTEPSWAARPSPDDLGEAYPTFASMIGQYGRVKLRCEGTSGGELADCRATETTPPGLGFDRAALSLTDRFRLHPRQVGDRVTEAEVEFSIVFQLSEEPENHWLEPEPTLDEVTRAREVAARHLPPPERMMADLGPGKLGVDPDREAWVRQQIIEAETELRPARLDAMALAWARLLDIEMIESLSAGQRRPPPPDPARMKAALNGMDAVHDVLMERLRARYCDRYPCVIAPRD